VFEAWRDYKWKADRLLQENSLDEVRGGWGFVWWENRIDELVVKAKMACKGPFSGWGVLFRTEGS